MKLNNSFLFILGLAAMAQSFCPTCITSVMDKLDWFLTLSPNKTIKPRVNATAVDVGLKPVNRSTRCLGLFDWLFEDYDTEVAAGPTKPIAGLPTRSTNSPPVLSPTGVPTATKKPTPDVQSAVAPVGPPAASPGATSAEVPAAPPVVAPAQPPAAAPAAPPTAPPAAPASP
ncbi:hypothetical protein C0J52_19784, partial [Blattella germanica]